MSSLLDRYSNHIHTLRRAPSSGEFHTFRLPVPGLWLDILQKVKAGGFNAISVYSHMALINPSPGVVDFNDYRALEPLYEAAKQTGIWIVLRPGIIFCILKGFMLMRIRALYQCGDDSRRYCTLDNIRSCRRNADKRDGLACSLARLRTRYHYRNCSLPSDPRRTGNRQAGLDHALH